MIFPNPFILLPPMELPMGSARIPMEYLPTKSRCAWAGPYGGPMLPVYTPQIGFSWLTSRRTGPTGTASGSWGTAVEYSTQNSAVNKNKFMAEAGLDVNFSVFRNLILTAGALYSLGLQPIEKLNVSYQINDQIYEGVIHSKGSGWKFNLGLRILLYSSN